MPSIAWPSSAGGASTTDDSVLPPVQPVKPMHENAAKKEKAIASFFIGIPRNFKRLLIIAHIEEPLPRNYSTAIHMTTRAIEVRKYIRSEFEFPSLNRKERKRF